MIELSEQLRKEVQVAGSAPVRLVDAETNEQYVLLRADVFERLHTLDYDDSDFDPREVYPLVDRVMAEDDANDPYLAEYQKITHKEK